MYIFQKLVMIGLVMLLTSSPSWSRSSGGQAIKSLTRLCFTPQRLTRKSRAIKLGSSYLASQNLFLSLDLKCPENPIKGPVEPIVTILSSKQNSSVTIINGTHIIERIQNSSGRLDQKVKGEFKKPYFFGLIKGEMNGKSILALDKRSTFVYSDDISEIHTGVYNYYVPSKEIINSKDISTAQKYLSKKKESEPSLDFKALDPRKYHYVKTFFQEFYLIAVLSDTKNLDPLDSGTVVVFRITLRNWAGSGQPLVEFRKLDGLFDTGVNGSEKALLSVMVAKSLGSLRLKAPWSKVLAEYSIQNSALDRLSFEKQEVMESEIRSGMFVAFSKGLSEYIKSRHNELELAKEMNGRTLLASKFTLGTFAPIFKNISYLYLPTNDPESWVSNWNNSFLSDLLVLAPQNMKYSYSSKKSKSELKKGISNFISATKKAIKKISD